MSLYPVLVVNFFCKFAFMEMQLGLKSGKDEGLRCFLFSGAMQDWYWDDE